MSLIFESFKWILLKKKVIESNSTLQNRGEDFPSLISTCSSLILFEVRLLTTPSRPGLNNWSVEINGGWSDRRNLKADGLLSLKSDSDTMLRNLLVPTQLYKTD